MDMKSSLLACALLAPALTVPALAQDPSTRTAEDPVTLTLSGSVTSSTAKALVIKADDGSRKTFAVDTESILPEKLARGTRVTVTYETRGRGMRAVSVSPTDAPAPTRPKAAPTPKPSR